MAGSKAPYVLTQADQEIIDLSWRERNPSIFTNFYVRKPGGGYYCYPGSVRHRRYSALWQELGKPQSFVAESGGVRFTVIPRFGDYKAYIADEEVENANIAFYEDRGFVFLPWQLDFFRSQQEQKTIIGTPGTGKTAGIGLLACYMCATIPNFRFLNVAPLVYQSSLMLRSIRETIEGTPFETRFLAPGRSPYKMKPPFSIAFANGSTAEFTNAQDGLANIQSWWGDWIHFDEAGLNNAIDETGSTVLSGMLIGAASRLRGTRQDGKPRLGWMTMASMAYSNDTMWELYDNGFMPDLSRQYYSRLVTFKDNPYLTPRDIERFKRNVKPGEEGPWLRGERPDKSGSEFPSGMIEQLFSKTQFEEAVKAGARYEYAGQWMVMYQESPIRDHVYVIAGDPGLGEPPHRNAPVIQVWDVTNFPREKARMVGFWWGFANGSLVPFLTKFDEWRSIYKVPSAFAGYDSTSSQKHIAELAWQTGESEVTPLGFDGSKKWAYINAAKVLMSKGLLMAPSECNGFRRQLSGYVLPDKKIAQDIVSTFCMACYMMMPLYRDVYPEWDEDDVVSNQNTDLFFADLFSRGSLSGRETYRG